MISFSRIFQLAQILVLIDAGPITPDACSPVKIQCVGEGEECVYDQEQVESNPGLCNGGTLSICRVCESDELSCHSGYCLKKIGIEGDRCSLQSEHVECKKGFQCTSGICREIPPPEETILLGRGEKCNPYDDKCIKTLMSDVNEKCSLPACKARNSNERCQINGVEGVALHE